MMLSPFVFPSTMRCCGMGSGMGSTVRCFRMATVAMSGRYCMATPMVVSIGAAVSMAFDVPSTSGALEAMFAPAMSVAPVRPGSHSQEDAVIEIARPIKTTGRAAIRCVVVIAIGTDRLNADAHANLRVGGWHQDPRGEQGCRTGQKKTAHGELISPARHAYNLPHVVILPNFCSRYP